MKWSDSRIEEDAKEEMADLSTVFNMIAQMPKPMASRILRYCLQYIESSKPEATPTMENAVKEMMAQVISQKKAV